jgi:hypothetical protein
MVIPNKNIQIKMKKNILLITIALLGNSWLSAQTLVKLKFNHSLAGKSFTKNTIATNNKGEDFTITRLQYYVSQIIVIHDNGMYDTFKGKYLLIDPSKDTVAIDLGTKTLTTVEAIQFSIGVDKAVNHNDPSLYGASHPLAPKSPSMHWGWSAGYRFIAIEGKAGASLNQQYELHGLGDNNYYTVRIPTTSTDAMGSTLIEINADYVRVLNNISVQSGVVAHGVEGEDKKALANMRDTVFTSITGQSSVLNVDKLASTITLGIYPNPINVGEAITIETYNDRTYTYQVYNINGKLVDKITEKTNSIQLNERGIYQVVAIDAKGNIVATNKVVVQ